MRKFLYFYIILFIVSFLFGGFYFGNKKADKVNLVSSTISKNQTSAKVTWVVDGDTIKVLIGNKEETVRLIGIDSPEVVDEKKPVQCFGREASDKAKEMLNGKTIILESDSTQADKDEYGRLLRYVFLQDGTNFNKFMISEGYAREYTFKGNSYKYKSEFEKLEKKAQEDRKGLWAENACN